MLQEIEEEAAMKTCRRRDDSPGTRAPSVHFRYGKASAFNLDGDRRLAGSLRAAVDLPLSGGRGCRLGLLFVFRGFQSRALQSGRSVGRHGVADVCAVRLRADGKGLGGAVGAHARYPSRAFDLTPRCANNPPRSSHRKQP
ncbi:jg7312 [Pararge aegeria aegeria]|uniref:Jg7312 protein n=1 Tax=Pararge aegeria aegeria TaxID=348720 RepID=A0A8S4RG45_9NEOP|nr:jg7312 [Pararge aegeria aegeria]